MVNLDRLKTIRQLSPESWHDGGDALTAYVEKLTVFTDNLPEVQENLRDAVAEIETEKIIEYVSQIRDMLIDVGASSIADECNTAISEIPNMSAGSLEAYAENLLGNVSSLSVDIQMSIYGQEQVSDTPKKHADSESDVIILAVDDNAFFLNTIKSYLQDTSYKLTCVNSGSVALRFLEKHSPSLFILDIDMPEMNGYELANAIREKGFTSPIIFLTGNASKEYVIKAVQAGASDFIIKPISKQQALEKIAKHV